MSEQSTERVHHCLGGACANPVHSDDRAERCKVYFDVNHVALGVCPLQVGSSAPDYYGDYYASEEMTVDPYNVVGRTARELRQASIERARRRFGASSAHW